VVISELQILSHWLLLKDFNTKFFVKVEFRSSHHKPPNQHRHRKTSIESFTNLLDAKLNPKIASSVFAISGYKK